MSTEPTVKINVGMQVSYIAGSTRECEVDTEIPRSKWDAMSEDERNKVLDEYAQGEIDDHVSAWANPINDE